MLISNTKNQWLIQRSSWWPINYNFPEHETISKQIYSKVFCVQVVWFLSKCSSVQRKARDTFQKPYGLGKGRRLKEIDKLLGNHLATLSLISLCSSGNLSTSWLIYVFSWKCDSCPFLDPAPFCSCCSSFCLKARVFSNCDLRFISTLVLKSFYPKYSHIVQWSTAS